MARAIDGEAAYRFLSEQLVKETGAFSKGVNKGMNIARSAMRNPDAIPTFTLPAEDNNVPTKAPNEPLTLEVLTKSQLFQMLGEKVEVIRMGEMCQAEWATVRSFGDCKTDSGRLCCHELYGKTWIAYHRPPEGEEGDADRG